MLRGAYSSSYLPSSVAALKLSLIPTTTTTTLQLSSSSSNLVIKETLFHKTNFLHSSSPSFTTIKKPMSSYHHHSPKATENLNDIIIFKVVTGLPLGSTGSSPLDSCKSTLVANGWSLFPSYSSGSSSGGQREILVQHLLVKEDDLKLLVELQKRISQGEDLSDLAVEYSICPSKEEGGMLGWVKKGQMVPEFEEAAFKAPVDRIVRCKTKFGWHLLQVLSEREESVLQDIQADELHVKMQDPNFFEEVQLIDVREPEEVAQASLPGFEILPLRQFGSWGPEITTKFDSQKDTYVLVCTYSLRFLLPG
ncbi:hypothetical protein LguiB_032396 [Lonicera macranthoides]